MYNISLAVLRSSNKGGLACMGRPFSLLTCGSPSIASPVTLNKRPFIASPTGIAIGLPVSVTLVPRTNPSVPSIAIVLTLSSPRCCCTSNTSLSPLSRVSSRAFKISGSLESVSNCTSTTAPMMDFTLPVLAIKKYLKYKRYVF